MLGFELVYSKLCFQNEGDFPRLFSDLWKDLFSSSLSIRLFNLFPARIFYEDLFHASQKGGSFFTTKGSEQKLRVGLCRTLHVMRCGNFCAVVLDWFALDGKVRSTGVVKS